MSGESLLLPGFDSGTGMVLLPWWAAAGLAAFLVIVVALATFRGGPALIAGGVIGIALLLLTVTIAWMGSERVAARDRAEERRALLTRAQDLARQAAMPGSVLGCLDTASGEAVELGCERALFSSPEAVAGSAAFTAARIALLSDGVDYSLRANASYEGLLPGLRVALEYDRFGFVAQVLTTHYDCSADHCDALTLFRETGRISANLKDRPFDIYVAKYAASWSNRARAPLLSSSGASPVPPGFNVPSAASIPPVSIMVPEQGSGSGSGAPAGSSGAAPSGATAAGGGPASSGAAPASSAGSASTGAAPGDAAAATPAPQRRAQPRRPTRQAQPKAGEPAQAGSGTPAQNVPTQIVPPIATTGNPPRPQ
jgi:hypothetical protein